MVWIVDNVTTLADLFADVATADPLSLVLFVTGAALVGVASAAMGYLALGAAADALTPDFSQRSPR